MTVAIVETYPSNAICFDMSADCRCLSSVLTTNLILVRKRGFEPLRYCYRQPLKLKSKTVDHSQPRQNGVGCPSRRLINVVRPRLVGNPLHCVAHTAQAATRVGRQNGCGSVNSNSETAAASRRSTMTPMFGLSSVPPISVASQMPTRPRDINR